MTLNRYPDRDAVELRKDLADYLGDGLTASHVWAANGSNEVIQQLLQAFGGPGRRALGFEPGYSMHSLIARVTGTRWVAADRDEDFGLDPDRAVRVIEQNQPDVIFLTSPNNPTGTSAPIRAIEAVCDAAPGVVIVDEAYAEFAREGTPQRAEPAAPLPRARGHPHHVQGVRHGGRQDRVPGRRSRGGREAAAGPAALSPVCRHPGGGEGRARAGRRAAGHRHVSSGRTGRGWSAGSGSAGCAVADSDANFVLFGEFEQRRDGLAGAARPRRAGPRGRAAALAAGHGGDAGGDGRFPRGTGRGAEEGAA